MMLTRRPGPALRPFVKTLWATNQADAPPPPSGLRRERVLPTGLMHVAVRLSDRPLRLFDGIDDRTGRIVGHAIVGGARTTFYLRDVSEPAASVGAVLYPGAAEWLVGVPAGTLAGDHVSLADLWGPSAAEARERLVQAASPERQLDLFESLLAARLTEAHRLHPAVAHALERFTVTDRVRQVVSETGYSQRRFIDVFHRAVGLTPKHYCRILRFQRVLRRAASKPPAGWAHIAVDIGYSDQPHLNREFRELAGVSPGEYRERSPIFPHHVPLRQPPDVRS